MQLLIDGSAAALYRDTGIGTYAQTFIQGISHCFSEQEQLKVLSMGKVLPYRSFLSMKAQSTPAFWDMIQQQKNTVIPSEFDLYHNTQNGIGMPHFSGHKIITVHDLIPLILPQYCGSPYKELFKEYCLQNAEKADLIITVSRQSKQDFITLGKIPPQKIAVIYEAPKSCFCCGNASFAAAEIYRKYKIKTPFFLYVGGFNPRKNLQGLLNAMAIFRSSHQKHRLVIPAKDSTRFRQYREAVIKMKLEDCIDFPFSVSDKELCYFYNACTALIYPSFYEGFGLPPLEAAACRKPTVLSDIPVHREIMAEAALYINPHSPGEIAAAMSLLADAPDFCERLGASALQQSRHYTITETVKQTLAVYRKVCR